MPLEVGGGLELGEGGFDDVAEVAAVAGVDEDVVHTGIVVGFSPPQSTGVHGAVDPGGTIGRCFGAALRMTFSQQPGDEGGGVAGVVGVGIAELRAHPLLFKAELVPE